MAPNFDILIPHNITQALPELGIAVILLLPVHSIAMLVLLAVIPVASIITKPLPTAVIEQAFGPSARYELKKS